jgi:ankyrin repeat protein
VESRWNGQEIVNRQETVVKLLLESGVDVDARDHSLSTSLYMAVANDQEMFVRLFLEKGVDINTGDKTQAAALHIAVRCGRTVQA